MNDSSGAYNGSRDCCFGLRNLLYANRHHLPSRISGGGTLYSILSGHSDVERVRGQWFVAMPAQAKIASMTVGAFATKVRANRIVECLRVFPSTPYANLVEGLAYRFDDSMLGIRKYLTFLQTAILQCCIPLLQLLDDFFALFCSETSFHSAPLPVHAIRFGICPGWLHKEKISIHYSNLKFRITWGNISHPPPSMPSQHYYQMA